MTDQMTPDQARALLDGTTPGPWGVDYDGAWEPGVWSPDIIVFGPYYDREDMEQWEAGSAADLRLAAAAPTLAATLAEMREEWGVRYESPFGGLVAHHEQWMDSENRPLDRYAARRFADGCERSGYENVRIVRRYVTEPEEA